MREVQPFRFKHFDLFQSGDVMKIGTDAVLLGAWAQPALSGSTLDVGTGTGILSLMLAQRGARGIDAIDVETAAVELAQQNVAHSHWSDRIAVHRCTFQEWATKGHDPYGHIISNPPYFDRSLTSPHPSRAVAKHTVLLPYTDLLQSSLACLAQDGHLSVIFPTAEGEHFIALAAQAGLYLRRMLRVIPRPGASAKRVLCEFSRTHGQPEEQQLILYGTDGQPTDAYRQLTGEFYLAF